MLYVNRDGVVEKGKNPGLGEKRLCYATVHAFFVPKAEAGFGHISGIVTGSPLSSLGSMALASPIMKVVGNGANAGGMSPNVNSSAHRPRDSEDIVLDIHDKPSMLERKRRFKQLQQSAAWIQLKLCLQGRRTEPRVLFSLGAEPSGLLAPQHAWKNLRDAVDRGSTFKARWTALSKAIIFQYRVLDTQDKGELIEYSAFQEKTSGPAQTVRITYPVSHVFTCKGRAVIASRNRSISSSLMKCLRMSGEAVCWADRAFPLAICSPGIDPCGQPQKATTCLSPSIWTHLIPRGPGSLPGAWIPSACRAWMPTAGCMQ